MCFFVNRQILVQGYLLFQSLSNAYYNYCDNKIEINIIVFIDTNSNDDDDDERKATTGIIIQEIQQFQTTWQYGNVKYILHHLKTMTIMVVRNHLFHF